MLAVARYSLKRSGIGAIGTCARLLGAEDHDVAKAATYSYG